jgi:ribose/xylose/arabinose/galactoside ABC-type transport system permease subunit
MMAETVGQKGKVSFKEVAKRVVRHHDATLFFVLLAIVFGLGAATGGRSLMLRNVRQVIVATAATGVSAIGQAYVILTAGIDLSVAGIAFGTSALGGSMMTDMLVRNLIGHQVAIWQGIPAMLAMGAGLGLASGLLVSRIGMPPLIATLGIWQIGHGIGFQITRGFTITRMLDSLRDIGQGSVLGFPVPGIILIAIAVVSYFVWNYTTYGKSVFATGSNPGTAYLSGIKVKNIQLSVYVISGILFAVAGLIYTTRVMSVSYQSFSGMELQSIAAAVVGGMSLFGGRGSILGVVFGSFIIGVITNGMNILGADPFLEGTVLGVLVLVAVGIDFWRRGR